jgi:hypothetical protein
MKSFLYYLHLIFIPAGVSRTPDEHSYVNANVAGIHAHMFALGEKYDISELKKTAQRKFEFTLRTHGLALAAWTPTPLALSSALP